MRAPGSTPDISDRYSLHFLPLPSESQRRIYCTSSEVLPELPAVRFSAEYNFFDFKRVHSMAQKYEAGKEFPELLIANYDLFERERQQPHQLTLFDSIDKPLDYEKILKENIVCRIKR